ncbi:MAG: DNA polymerase III subunit delta' [Armatimonadota bacterium]|nr:DNA polymerase III subunit delta' [Armatimonadota bacterium]
MAFRDVVDQHHAVRLLRTAVRTGRPSHAYLLVGPVGVGRRTLALAFAQYLNCPQADRDACGVCRDCVRIAQGQHPDVRVLDMAADRWFIPPPREHRGREIPIDQVRALRQDAAYPPYEGRVKVYIIADAELLSPGAANSLLKVLEEPPPDVVIVLIAESTVSLPPTVLSRCQVVRCALLSASEVERALVERYGVPAERARFLAAIAAGRLGRALAWAQDESRLAARRRFLDLLGELETATDTQRLDAAEALARDRDLLPDLLELAAFWYRDLLVWQETQDPTLLVNRDREAEIRRWAAILTPEDLHRRFDAVEHAKDSLERNVQPRLLLERFFYQLRSPAVPA